MSSTIQYKKHMNSCVSWSLRRMKCIYWNEQARSHGWRQFEFILILWYRLGACKQRKMSFNVEKLEEQFFLHFLSIVGNCIYSRCLCDEECGNAGKRGWNIRKRGSLCPLKMAGNRKEKRRTMSFLWRAGFGSVKSRSVTGNRLAECNVAI